MGAEEGEGGEVEFLRRATCGDQLKMMMGVE
jgi:hypothetical protein